MEHALNEQDRARLYFLQKQIKDRISKNCPEDIRLVPTVVIEICQILSKMEKH
jgi:hypothetical protein